jgi:hypothetical protein
VLREIGDNLQVFSTPGVVAMASMSAARVGWMVGVWRSVVHLNYYLLVNLKKYSVLEWQLCEVAAVTGG